MLTAPYVHFNNDPRKVHHVTTTSTSPTVNSQHGNGNGNNVMTMIDYTNLYIKNLDSDVTSYDLFKRFRVYGKIISARVMKDTITSKSKGYGFVSFTHMEEANEALQQMNGALVNTKNIVVTFHEHKKQINPSTTSKRQTPPPQQQQQATMTLPSPNMIHHSYPSPQSISYPNYGFIPEQPKNITVTPPTHNPWNETGIWMHSNGNNNNKPSPAATGVVSVPHPAYHTSMHVPTTTTTNASNNNNNTILVSPTCSTFQQQQHQIQYQKLKDAIALQLNEYQYKDLNDLVDLIQSLKKRDLSLCLFNPSFLKQKIDEAYEALYLFQNNNNVVVAQQPQQQQSNDTKSHHSEHSAAMAILSSLEGMSLNKKKRVFGDIFFPYVRATGVKHAPKVTIRLLDSVPLDELAFSMYDKEELTKKAQYAYNELYG